MKRQRTLNQAWMTQQDIMSREMSQTQDRACVTPPMPQPKGLRSRDGKGGARGERGEEGGLPRMAGECVKGTELRA